MMFHESKNDVLRVKFCFMNQKLMFSGVQILFQESPMVFTFYWYSPLRYDTPYITIPTFLFTYIEKKMPNNSKTDINIFLCLKLWQFYIKVSCHLTTTKLNITKNFTQELDIFHWKADKPKHILKFFHTF